MRNDSPNLQVPVGRRFERWIVLDHPAVRTLRGWWWLCRCDCGTERAVRPHHLRGGESRSCGCLQREIAKNNTGQPTHGLSKAPAYRAWAQAKQCCHNPNNPAWPYYGGRGISMALEWREDFTAFYEDVGPRPSSEYRFGRIDNEGDYEPGNVEWRLLRARQSIKRFRKSHLERRSEWLKRMRAKPEPEPGSRRGWWFWRGRRRPQ